MAVKTLRRSLQLSASGVLSFTLTSAVLNLLLPSMFGDAKRESITMELGTLLLTVLVLLAVLAALIAIGAYWLQRFFGEAYYGRHAAKRWALFGALYALLITLPGWFIPQSLWLLRVLLQFGGLFVAFFSARALIPLRMNR